MRARLDIYDLGRSQLAQIPGQPVMWIFAERFVEPLSQFLRRLHARLQEEPVVGDLACVRRVEFRGQHGKAKGVFKGIEHLSQHTGDEALG